MTLTTLPEDRGPLLHRKYWLDTLQGSLPQTTLLADGPRVAGGARATLGFELSGELSQRLITLSRDRALSLYLFLLAGVSALLREYTGDDELLLGSPACLSTDPPGVPGNLVPLRLRASGAASFETHLRGVVDSTLAAYAHQALPFEELLQRLGVPRCAERWPLFDVLVGLEGLHAGAPFETVTCDVVLAFRKHEATISGQVRFVPGLHREATLRRFVARLLHLLERAAAQPRARLDALAIAAPDEGRVFAEAHAFARPLPAARLVHQLFEEQARRTPERTAIAAGDDSLSFRELDARANRLAHALRREGVGPEVLVALYARRGVEFLTAMLAVFKAGGAYLPLDTSAPTRRLAQVLSQSASRLVLLGEGLDLGPVLEGWSADARPRVLPLATLGSSSDVVGEPTCANAPGSLAYVIYTSGSTGVPKGAMLEQQGLLNHLHAKVWDLELGPDDVIAQNSAACFDVSVWQFLCALLVGGRTEVLSEDVNRDARALLVATETRGITVLEIVPSQLRAMLAEATAAPGRYSLARLRFLVVNGEVLPPELCRAWLALFPHAHLINAYGPTECSDDVTHHKLVEPPGPDCLRVSIGRSLPNMRLYVLDPELRPRPVGLTGELFVGGVGVGRGYLGDPVRSAQSFRPDPFASTPGARLYATGDRVRFLEDGSLDFLGRVDHQIKLRGYRIETREIEVLLRSHPGVREAVVVVRADATGQDRLVAYLVADAAPLAGELRAFLQERLPEYMLPAAFVVLPALPLLDNGKIDRRALPEPSDAATATSVQAEPRTPLEQSLVQMWAETLGLARVGIHDSFFDLGGHSLLALHLIARVRDAFDIELPLARLFEGPTVAELAVVVAELQAGQMDPEELASLIAEARGDMVAP